MRNASSMGVLYAHTLFTGQREKVEKRERKRESEKGER
jgi:hypothetical protein